MENSAVIEVIYIVSHIVNNFYFQPQPESKPLYVYRITCQMNILKHRIVLEKSNRMLCYW